VTTRGTGEGEDISIANEQVNVHFKWCFHCEGASESVPFKPTRGERAVPLAGKHSVLILRLVGR